MAVTVFSVNSKKEISQRKLEVYSKYNRIIQWGRRDPVEFCSRIMGIELYFDQIKVDSVGADEVRIVTAHKAEGLEGGEIDKIYLMVDGNPLGKEFTQDSTASEGKFAYDPATKEITLLASDVKESDIFTMIYEYKSSGAKISNKGDKFAKSGKLLVEIIMRDVCDNETVYSGIMVMPNASVDGNFTMAFGGEPMMHNFKAEALQEQCSNNKELWHLIIPTE